MCTIIRCGTPSFAAGASISTRRASRSTSSTSVAATTPKRPTRARAAFFLQGAGGLRQWVEAILGQRLEALIYPEIGMDALTIKLASLRLAPVQIAAWGHPETTGLPTLDHYLSAEDLEPADAQRGYRERLVLLPRLGCAYRPLPVSAADTDFGNLSGDPGVPLLLCPGTPYKYVPKHDWMFVEIARRLGRCGLVFFTHVHSHLSQKLQRRLEASFARAGARFSDYGIFIPWLPRPSYYALMKRADAMLDTIGFSGFNTAVQAAECALPVVTCEGAFLRGRLQAGSCGAWGSRISSAPATTSTSTRQCASDAIRNFAATSARAS